MTSRKGLLIKAFSVYIKHTIKQKKRFIFLFFCLETTNIHVIFTNFLGKEIKSFNILNSETKLVIMKQKKIVITYFFLISVALSFAQTSKLVFIQNKGQWGRDISYKSDFPGGQALATASGMLVGAFDQNALLARSEWGKKMEDRETGAQYLLDHPTAPDLKGHGWKFHFLNGNPSPQIVNQGQSSDFYNFWVGDPSQHASKVRSYEALTYKDVYNNIDVKYYGTTTGDLENDIIVHPYADLSNLAFELEGIDDIKQNSLGDLILTTTVGDISIPAPISYLLDGRGARTPIAISFVLDQHVIRFAIPNYDNSQTLVIDPVVLRWATWATNATSADSHNHGSGLDSLGNLYVTGRLNSTGLITVGAFQSTAGGGVDLFIGKYTEPSSPGGTGSRIWQTYLGGAQDENNIALQMGADGYIYLIAKTKSDMPKTAGTGFTASWTTQRTATGGTLQQLMVVKLDLAGNGALTREIGSVTKNFGFSPADLRIYKTGVYTYQLICSGYITQPSSFGGLDGDFPGPKTPAGTAYTQPASSTDNALIMRITNNFDSIYWIRNIGSDSASAKDERLTISAVDAAGNIYTAGYTTATQTISFMNPSTQTTRVGSQDGWIMKLNSSGTVQWSRYFNSSGAGKTTSILSMELNRADTNLIIAGITTGLLALKNITTGAAQTVIGGGQDLFVAKISKTGSMTNWGTYLGGSGTEDNMMGLNTDLNDDIYVLGYSNSTDYPITANPIQSTNFGINDAVFTKLSSSGATKIYSTYYGGRADDDDPLGQRGILFSACRIYLSVTASSTNIPLTQGAVNTGKTSISGILEPVIVSLANPPDVSNATISSSQTLSCGQTPTTLTAGAAAYNIATVLRSDTVQTTGTAGSYPSGVPTPSGYQWQQSIDYTNSWTDIALATGQNYSPPALVQTTYYRRIISGDYCTNADFNVCITITGGPKAAPSVTCAGSTASFFSNATGGSGSNTYSWTGPLGFTSSLTNPQILSASNANNGYYSVTVTAGNGCKDTKVIYLDFNSCTYFVVLSVSLLDFHAEKTGTSATLTWQTANEHNSETFTVERSNNITHWDEIGSIKAAGSSNSVIGYSFVDEQPLDGMNYYRIRVTDLDGGIRNTQIRNLNFIKPNTVQIINVMPNPFTNNLTVNYDLPGTGVVVISIIDAQGRILSSAERDGVKGSNAMVFDTSNYAKGLYFVTINYIGIRKNYKMIVKE